MKYLLFPLAVLYGWITDLRNWLYDTGRLKAVSFNLPVISIGNLRVGGTGKTPFIEYMIRLLAPKHKIAVLSRGYGRKTKGFRLANPASTAQEIGDEPLQLYSKYGDQIHVCVGEERILAIPELLALHPETEVILLDDAFQHRSIRPYFQILLSDYENLFYNDYLLPMGRLRERRKHVRRTHFFIITKCPPDLSKDEKTTIIHRILSYAPQRIILFTSLTYGNPYNIFTKENAHLQKVALLSGIAQPQHFEKAMREKFEVIKHFIFPDHHFYTQQEIAKICDFLEKNPDTTLLCTEKDAVKLQKMQISEPLKARFFSIGIEIYFPDETEEKIFKFAMEHLIKNFYDGLKK
ncbi:MAG: tetraacyldisaccharide 4'-kinase [Raineya sp.]|nr:tetraacyldisaccharide 4'-kinase [Raineya sp.]